MHKIISSLVLALSIHGAVFAQDISSPRAKDRLFDFNDRHYHLRYRIDLATGNWIRLDILDDSVLSSLHAMDSLLRVFTRDIAPLRDSLTDELTIKKIDYRIDSSGRREIRIQQFPSKGSSYVIDKGDLAALKLEQDTIYIYASNYRITLVLNQIMELSSLLDGTIDAKIRVLDQSKFYDWVVAKDGRMHIKSDPSISEARREQKWGNRIQPHDEMDFNLSMSIQNYKNYFVPSFNLGLRFVLNNFDWKRGNSSYKYVLGAYWEPQFFFRNTPGGLSTYRNDFVTVTFGYGRKDPDIYNRSVLNNDFSISYLVGNKGGFYAPHTFRVGLDEVQLFKRLTMIGPLVYFNNFFKGVTPGLRITQTF
jgi:hypothetical protein